MLNHRPTRSFLALAMLSAAPACAADRAESSFSAEAFLSHIRYLADDELAGRGLGTEGIEKAAHYIASEWSKVSVQPGGEDGGYFQSFTLTLRRELTDKVRLTIADENLRHGEDYIVTNMSTGGPFNGPLAFVGYGISAPDFDYDDYVDFDAEGKVLLMLRYEPYADDRDAAFGGEEHSEHAYFRTKIALAKEKGARAVLLVNPPQHHTEDDDLDELSVTESDARRDFGLPFLQVSRETADRLLSRGGLPALATLQERLDRDRKTRSADLMGLTAEGDTGLKTIEGTVRNVIGLVRATGDKADEYVVIGAHYDHLGHARSAFRRGDSTKHIHNGADDNASGTAALIELGRRFAAQRETLRRSVVLIAFTAEETGLLGSKHFVDHPTIPLDRVVTMLNLDMIGRLRDDKLQIFGTETASEYEALLQRIAEPLGFELSLEGSGIGPSDHTSFYHHEIPVLHFFTGTHRDYHRPSDDIEFINADGGVLVTEMVYRVAAEVGQRDDRLTFQATKAARGGGRPRAKVRLGLMPSYSDDDQPGMAIDGVSPESPAERAGLKSGDRIVKLGNTPVGDVYDLMQALSKLEPEQTVPIVVKRDDDEVELSITPEAP